MPFDKEQTKAIATHLKARRMSCPVCRNTEFQLVEVTSLPINGAGTVQHLANLFPQTLIEKTSGKPALTFSGVGSADAPERVFPVAIVSCTTCFYLMQFAWMPIWERYRNG